MVKSAFANVVNGVLSSAAQDLRRGRAKGNSQHRLEQAHEGPCYSTGGISRSTWEG